MIYQKTASKTSLKNKIDAEVQFMLRKYGKYLAFLRRHPIHAARILFSIIIPPHESSMLLNAWMGYRENLYKCSRGTSKTFTIGSLFPPLVSLLFRNKKLLVASASRFRGGKMVLKDSERLITGQLDSQKLDKAWVKKSIDHVKTIRHEPDIWSLDFKSSSSVFTLPTNNEEAIRGVRANIMILDERNTFEGEAIQKVYAPFLAVGTDFESPAEGSEGNQIFAIGTIDYSYRDWYKEIQATKDLAKIQYEVYQALYKQDWDTYDALMQQHQSRLLGMSVSFNRYDYTDLLIPTQIAGYKVHYPGARPGKDIRWDDRDQREYIYTYPVNKRQLEAPLDDGIIDRESWEAEQRNVFIRASGSVYSPALVEKATGAIFTEKDEREKGWDPQKQGSSYVPPVLYKCSDPCILGVDTARTADFTAMVVIRVGYLSEDLYGRDTYSLKAHKGPSDWSNVIWAEQHHHFTTKETAELIHHLRERYNIVSIRNVPGIVMDARGGGAHVRDELAMPSPLIDGITGEIVPGWKAPQKIYDMNDKEYNHLRADVESWAGLKLLVTTDLLNQELVTYSRAQMEVGRLYVGAYKALSERGKDGILLSPGYSGVRTLKHQMLRIQATPTASGKSVRFEIPGDNKKLENKKDMLMAFLYACYALRDFQNAFTKKERTAPVAYGTVVRL